jgi:pimeloyl-ACP methyl ester carboxylesterase
MKIFFLSMRMKKLNDTWADDASSASQLSTEAILGIVTIVEEMHSAITKTSKLGLKRKHKGGLSGFIFSVIRFFTRATGFGLQHGFKQLSKALPASEASSSPSQQREALLAIVNGVLGNHLVEMNSPSAIPMRFRLNGKSVNLTEFSTSSKPVLLMVHGLCMNDLQWTRKGHNHGEKLCAKFGFRPLYLHYNSGRHISQNGEELNEHLENLVNHLTPETPIHLLLHSMGGLITRSAFEMAKNGGYSWPERIDSLFFLGTPHHGAPMEKAGNWIDTMLESNKYSAPLSRLGKIRSAGITDMRWGNLSHEDWQNRDRFHRKHKPLKHIPLPSDIPCFTVAASKSNEPKLFSDHTLGDGLVTLHSALGEHRLKDKRLTFQPERSHIVRGISHFALLESQNVYEKLEYWFSDLVEN